MVTFVDTVVLYAAAGDGGNGCASIHREKFKPLGGPDGGNGGRGGSVVLVVDPSVTTLLDFHFHPHQKATSGKQGQGNNRSGAQGEDLILRVPSGTVVKSEDGEQIVDLVGAGTRFVLCRGGAGGLGNAALASSRRKAPGFALLGEEGESLNVNLELKTVADVALVGFPSAGKSSLISVISAAKPKVADYPFTTLVPNLGVVNAGEYVFTVADVPGLIPGASEGKGLGHDFLRHVERCTAIVHVLDGATLESDRDPSRDLEAIERELAAYDAMLGTDLSTRPRLVVINKIDVPDARDLAEMVTPDLEARGLRVFPVSTVTREGLRPLVHALAALVAEARAAQPVAEATRIVLRPRGHKEVAFTVSHRDGVFVVDGERPRRWVRQTDFNNEEAVGYLADRLAKLGVEDELVRLGAQPGDEVMIGDTSFDWEPTMLAGVELVAGPRGTDLRLEDSIRISRADRNARNAARFTRADPYVTPAEDDAVEVVRVNPPEDQR